MGILGGGRGGDRQGNTCVMPYLPPAEETCRAETIQAGAGWSGLGQEEGLGGLCMPLGRQVPRRRAGLPLPARPFPM